MTGCGYKSCKTSDKAKREKKKEDKKVKIPIKPKAKPLMQPEAQYFQELVDSSNKLTGLQKQVAQFEFIIGKLQENRNKIQKGDVKLPVVMVLIPKIMYYQEDDKKKILGFFDEQIKSYQTNIISIKNQMEHRQEEYEESAVRNREFLATRYGNLTAKHIVAARKEVADEENLFEAELSKLAENDEVMKEFKKAKKEAVKRNKARQTKKAK